MPLVFDSVLTAALARELDSRWSGRRLESLRFDRGERRVLLGLTDEAWVWLLHPREGVLAALGRSHGGDGRPSSGGRRRSRDRGVLEGPRRVRAVESPPDTRHLLVQLAGPAGTDECLVFDLVTNRWNALHVVGGRVRSVLVPDLGRSPVRPGDDWRPPVSQRRWAETTPDAGEWATLLNELGKGHGDPARRHVAWLSGINEAALLGGDPLESVADEREREAGLERYLRLRDAALRDAPGGWLLPPREGDDDDDDIESARHPYPWSLERPDAERVGTLLDALAAYGDRSPRIAAALRAAAEDPETARLREAIEDRGRRAARKIRALEAEVDAARDPEELRRLGHLLLARKASVPAGAEEVRLEGFDGGTVSVELDPALDPIGNAEAYYDRAKRLERAAERLPARIEEARRRLAALDDGLERLDAQGPDEALWRLGGGRRRALAPGSGRRGRGRDRAGAERPPYRVYRTSNGLEVRAGRSAKANDELTFRHSGPDDIWMHVREAPGSHVVLRWGRKDQNPPESDIAEAALVAAVLSRARGSAIVPVAWTRRKYVRKARKARPGTVIPERTTTVFVRPDALRVEAMAEDEE